MSGKQAKHRRHSKFFTAYATAHNSELLDSLKPSRQRGAFNWASWYIGKGCVALAAQRRRLAEEHFAEAGDHLQKANQALDNVRHPHHINARLLAGILTLLQRRHEDGIIDWARRSFRQTAIDGLKLNRSRLIGAPDTVGLVGEITEQTTLGLLNSTGHPGRVAIPALFHEDYAQEKKISFDAILIRSNRKRAAAFDKLQVKSRCIRVCKERRDDPALPHQARYNEDITLVSGHCDFGQRQAKRQDFNEAFPIARLLIDSEGDMPEPTHPLAIRATNLIESIIADPQRKGLIPLTSPGDLPALLETPPEIAP